MQAEPRNHPDPIQYESMNAVAKRDVGQTEAALDVLHRSISVMENEVAGLVLQLAPITQPVPESGDTPRGDDPLPPCSSITRTVREANDRVEAICSRVKALRAYLDL